MADLTRRRFLALGSAGVAGGLAGCSAREELEQIGSELRETRRQDADLTSDGPAEFDDETRQRLREAALGVRESVVHLGFGRGRGTGWVLDGEAGYLVTNAHVARRSDSFEVETFEGETGRADPVEFDSDLDPDVGLLRTDLSGLQPLSTGDSDDLSKDDPLLTVGHPGQTGKWIISAGRYDRHLERVDWLLSNVPTAQGNSGGPLVSLDGVVVGLVTGTTAPQESPHSRSNRVFTDLPQVGLTTAVPVETVLETVEGWR
jgi:serine protease Do